MADVAGRPANFWLQSNALLRKNLTFQKRRMCANIALILIPAFFCSLFAFFQIVVDVYTNKPNTKCGTDLADIGHFDDSCPIPKPPEWPALLKIPQNDFRAVRSDFLSFKDLPDESCRKKGSCPVTILMTGTNHSLAQTLASSMFSGSLPVNSSGNLTDWAKTVMGTESPLQSSYMFDPAFTSPDPTPISNLQRQCPPQLSTSSATLRVSTTPIKKEVTCVQALYLWRNSSSEINNELYKGYMKGNSEKKINEILSAYDFSNSNAKTYNVTLWYNSTTQAVGARALLRLPRTVNMATNAYLQSLKGPKTKIMFDFVKEMPKSRSVNKMDFASLAGTIFFTWIVLQLFPVVLTAIVYEKEQRLRIMMKMHGLGDGPYWMISYVYFLTISALYMLCFIGFGSLLGLSYFTQNDYSIQFVFFFIYINLQIALAFLLASVFSDTRTATVVAYIFVFGSGLLGAFFFEHLIKDASRSLLVFLELYPGFSLYRGLYELGQYAIEAKALGTRGMTWENLNDSYNGMRDVMVIMGFEWLGLLLLAYYIDQVVTCGKGPLFFLQNSRNKNPSTLRMPTLQRQGSKAFGDMDKPDISNEREKVEKLLQDPNDKSHVVICDNVKKVYPGRDGNPEKFAVRGLSLALLRGECFGMLGPSGAGKTSFIEMMIGLTKPTFGTSYVNGLDIVTQMNEIYTCMGVCPQYDLLWETLTGREHLLFYGRLKNLKGSVLTNAVEESLKNLNLFHGGVADKQAGQYSGGMKRRLSVAISLIGNPIAVYMDEPSTGLDPASRNTLWNVIKLAKQDRVIILTTHSMEEAEFLCDRLGIFVDGRMQCIGNPKELRGRYGGSYVFQMTTNSDHEQEIEDMVMNLSPNANRVYILAGTQKFELPKNEVRIADVFQTIEHAKTRFTVYAWGLADTTLEDVFIKVASAPRKIESNVLNTD
ncbi:hypothetical protein L3X38_029382 [Prunus dulcis]|uniref:ABC transporter domain-containing protein n=1 Tax=Prunus dulcis TaxID=3755 RepID=A0AAD4VRI6_PRUDU|nr:hypothetical protein L3X38_029382 [Prunus dulcis]